MAKRNLSQTDIDRKKRLGANLTRATSAVGLGSLVALGAGAAAPKLARAGKVVGLTEEKALKFKESTKNKALTAGIVTSGVGGYNGFNNATWQSAESRQRKQKVPVTMAKSDTPSPFEDYAIAGSEGNSQSYMEEITKGWGAGVSQRSANTATKAVKKLPKKPKSDPAQDHYLRASRKFTNLKERSDAGQKISPMRSRSFAPLERQLPAYGGRTGSNWEFNGNKRVRKSLGTVSAFGVMHD